VYLVASLLDFISVAMILDLYLLISVKILLCYKNS
jgi:hypothetical protein